MEEATWTEMKIKPFRSLNAYFPEILLSSLKYSHVT
jgi:hypothetical protein